MIVYSGQLPSRGRLRAAVSGEGKKEAQMAMEAVMGGVVAKSQAQAPATVSGALPLAMLGEDETATVVKVKGSSELRKHLSDLGLVEGACIKVISRVDGDVIVNVKGARLALNRAMSSHVMVSL